MKHALLGGALALLASFGAAAKGEMRTDAPPPGPAPSKLNLVVEGHLPDATMLEISIVADAKEETQWSLALAGGKLLTGLASPAGEERRVRLSAADSRGEKLYEGEAVLGGGTEFSAVVELKSVLDGAVAEVTLASHRVAIEFAAVEGKDAWLTRAIADVYDAGGRRLQLKEGELDWEIDDPWIREHLQPCPESHGGSLCIEFQPRKPDGTQAVLNACFRGGICRLEFVPPIPEVWRKVVVSAEAHACALKKNGEAYCWGKGEQGQLGYAAPKICDSSGLEGAGFGCGLLPQPVQCTSGTCRFIDITAGARHTCALDRDQRAWCWGDNSEGALGVGNYDANPAGDHVPQLVYTNLKFLSIHGGQSSTCGLSVGHQVWCWGNNNGALVPHLANRWLNTPQLVQLDDVEDMDYSYAHVCARKSSGELFCWGSNFADRLGPGAFTAAPRCQDCPDAPLLMQGRVTELNGEPVSLVTAGGHGTCAHTSADRTPCWGEFVPAFPSRVPLDRLSRGFLHYCAISRGVLSCAGLGALGDGSDRQPHPGGGPVLVGRPPDFFREVDAGNLSTCGIGRDEQVYCWGANLFSVLGLGFTKEDVTRPTALLFPMRLPPPHWYQP